MKILAITVLTSFSEESWSEVAPGTSIEAAIRARAKLCDDTGLDGLVCSPLDLPIVKSYTSPRLLKVVPGVRLAAAGDDQTRVATPKDAIIAGADYLVMGRPIYKAKDLEGAMDAIKQSIQEGLSCRV